MKRAKIPGGKHFKDLPEGMPFDDLLKKFFGDRDNDNGEDDFDFTLRNLNLAFGAVFRVGN